MMLVRLPSGNCFDFDSIGHVSQRPKNFETWMPGPSIGAFPDRQRHEGEEIVLWAGARMVLEVPSLLLGPEHGSRSNPDFPALVEFLKRHTLNLEEQA